MPRVSIIRGSRGARRIIYRCPDCCCPPGCCDGEIQGTEGFGDWLDILEGSRGGYGGGYDGTSDGSTCVDSTEGSDSGSGGVRRPDRSSGPAENNPRIRRIIFDNGATPPLEAASKLQKVATVMKPVMEEYDLRLESLAELRRVEEADLHGYNSGRLPHRIYLNLRHRPWSMVLDTMLHELAHNIHRPHDRHFYKLWNKMRTSYSRLRGPEWAGPEHARRRLQNDDMPALATETPEIRCTRPSDEAPVAPISTIPPREARTATLYDRCPQCRKERYRCRCRGIYY